MSTATSGNPSIVIEPANTGSGNKRRRVNAGAGGADPITINPDASAAGGNAGHTGSGSDDRRSRGRPSGGGSRAGSSAKAEKGALDLTGLTGVVVSIHTMLAHMAQIPELNMSEDEAKVLLKASNDVARHYASGALNQKYVDWAHLLSAIGAIYGSRMMAYKFRMAANAAKDVTPRPNAPRTDAPQNSTEADFAMMNAMHQASQMP